MTYSSADGWHKAGTVPHGPYHDTFPSLVFMFFPTDTVFVQWFRVILVYYSYMHTSVSRCE